MRDNCFFDFKSSVQVSSQFDIKCEMSLSRLKYSLVPGMSAHLALLGYGRVFLYFSKQKHLSN